jgi:hypothetical protein
VAGGEHKLQKEVVGYVDLQRRREEGSRDHAASRHEGAHERAPDPYFFSTLGFGLATPRLLAVLLHVVIRCASARGRGPLVPSTIFVVLGVCQLQRERSSCAKPGPGAEKQLLMAIRDDTGR